MTETIASIESTQAPASGEGAVSVKGPAIDPPPRGERPFWSVMIPVYNRARYLEGAIRNVLGQDPGESGMHIEVIDDCSTEGEIESIVREVGMGRVKYFRQPVNLGLIGNWNACLSRSRGQYVHMLHDDDRIFPGFYESMRAGLETAGEAGMAFCRHMFIDESDAQTFLMQAERETPGIVEDFIDRIASMQRVQFASVVMKRSAIEEYGGFRPDLYFAADWEMWKRLAAHFPVWYEPRVLAAYRLHGGSETSRLVRSGRTTADTRRAIEAARAYLPKDKADRLSTAARQYYAADAMGLLRQACARGDLEAAIAHAREGVKCDDAPNVVNFLASGWGADADLLVASLTRQLQSTDAVTRDLAHVHRRQMAEGWLSFPPGQLATLYAGGFGKVNSLLMSCGIKAEPIPESDVSFVESLRRRVAGSSPWESPASVAPLLALTLYDRADQLSPPFDLPSVPPWFANDFLRYMHEPPHLFTRIGEADAYADHVGRWVAYLHENVLANPANDFWREVAAYFAQAGNFIAFYFNYRNVKETYRRRADIAERVLRSMGHQVDCVFPPRDPRRVKIRLGILSSHFNPQTETFATLPAYKHLNRELFEIVLVMVHQGGSRLERYCSGHADHVLVVPQGQLPQQVQAIRQLDLDMILIATNVTAVSNPITFLAMHRLARVQVNSVCSCVTSGMTNNDYYISGRSTEVADDPQSQYTETLRLLDGPAHCCDFGPEENSLPTQHPTRASMGIPDDAVVFASGSNFYKVIPEVEAAWVEILWRVPHSRLLLYPFNPNWSNAYPTGAFVKRLHAAMEARGVSADRLTVFPPVAGRGDILERLKVADLYLDSFPFSGITSLIDPLEVGLPTVVMDGDSFRSLMAPALLRELGVEGLIAKDKAAYVELAAGLAKDAALRAELGAKIAGAMRATPKFRDSRWYSGQVESLLQAMWKEKA